MKLNLSAVENVANILGEGFNISEKQNNGEKMVAS